MTRLIDGLLVIDQTRTSVHIPGEMGMKLQAKSTMTGLLIACLVAAGPIVKAAEFREYETADGRVVSGKVLEYSSKTEEVIFLREADNQLLQANLSAFSGKERQFIRDWAVAKEFLNGLSITGTLHWRKDKHLSSEEKLVQNAGYEILFNSTTGYPFGEIQVEYCIYYRQGKAKGQRMTFDRGVCHGTGAVKLETIHQKDALETQPITLYFLRGPYTLFGVANDVEGAVSGIWLRAKVILPSGQACIREYRSSKDDDWTWSSRSIPVGMNNSEAAATPRSDNHWSD